MKTINLYRVFVTPAAKGRRFSDNGFKGAFLSNPNKSELMQAIAHEAEALKSQLDKVRAEDDEDEFEIDIEEIKRKMDNLALVLEILSAWKPNPHTIECGGPIAIHVANVPIGVIRFEHEPVFDVRVAE